MTLHLTMEIHSRRPEATERTSPSRLSPHRHMEPFLWPGPRYSLQLFTRFGSLAIIVFAFGAWCRCTHAASSDDVALNLEDKAMLERGLAQEQSSDSFPPLITPNTPPPPEVADGATTVTVKINELERVVIVEKDFNVTELRGLMQTIAEEGGDDDPRLESVALTAQISARLKYGYERTEWWFEASGSMDVFENYLGDLVAEATERPLRLLEVGSFEGASAVWLAEHLLLHPESLLICLDTWEGNIEFSDTIEMSAVEERFKKNIARAPNGHRVEVIKGDSMLSLASLVAGGATTTFDMIYVDGSHEMANALMDGLLSFHLLKIGGLLVFDDNDKFPRVAAATSAFLEALGKERLEVILNTNQLVVRRIA